jgi:uncharacterized small protein (DUF1192 family)
MSTVKRFLEIRTETTCFDGTTVTTYAEVPLDLDEAAEREHCQVIANTIDGRADTMRTIRAQRAAVQAKCAAKMDELSGAYAKERDEVERLKAQLLGVGMQEFRRLEGRLHNAQDEIDLVRGLRKAENDALRAEIERLKAAHRELLQAGCLAAECLAEVRTGSDFEVECHEAGRDLRELLKGLDR